MNLHKGFFLTMVEHPDWFRRSSSDRIVLLNSHCQRQLSVFTFANHAWPVAVFRMVTTSLLLLITWYLPFPGATARTADDKPRDCSK